MDTSTTNYRREPTVRATPTPVKSPPRAVTTRRPSITTTLSTAYGAPGKVKMPNKVNVKPTGNMIEVMKTMMEDESESSDENESPAAEEVDKESTEEDEVDEGEEEDKEREDTEEVDEVEIEDEDLENDDENDKRERQPHAQDDSPFVAIANRFKRLWGSSMDNTDTSFIAEQKIASEARIARPREPLARKLLRWKEKAINMFEEYRVSRPFNMLLLLAQFFFGTLILLLLLQSLSSRLPNGVSIAGALDNARTRVSIPINSFLESLPSISRTSPLPNTSEIDLTQLKALRDATTAQFQQISSRLNSIESSYQRLAKKLKEPPIPERKVNLFAPGSGLVVDPYMSSPSRARDVTRKNHAARWYSRWRNHPDSIQHGPISAFLPWEDMGDCWCSPDSGGKSQLVVELAQRVIPKELVVEHVAKRATLQAGSAPRDIELWAQIRNYNKRELIKKVAADYDIHQDLTKNSDKHLVSLDDTWVKLGQWRYDIDGSSNVQSFVINVPLEEYKTNVQKLAFRSLNNWGPVDYVCLYRLKLHGLVENLGGGHEDGLGF